MSITKLKQVLLSLIDTYKDMPYLWQRDNINYLNRDLREKGFAKLLNVYKEFDEHATLKVVKKKLENMRTNYMKELRKVVASEETENLYVPTLWYYEALSFLGGRSELLQEDKEDDKDTDPLESVDASFDYEDESITASAKKRIKIEPRIKKLEYAPEPSEKLTRNSQTDDQWEVYGKTIGYQVRDLSGEQLVICQKLISDAIFYAKLSKLNEDSHIVNPVHDLEYE